MNATDPTSLTPSERELARQLANIAPRDEPSPSLDARILAAAREAGVSPSSTPPVSSEIFSTSVSRPGRIRPRWPVALGVAASLVLALGVAWRMQPLPELRQVRRTDAPVAPALARMSSTEIAMASRVESKADNTPPPMQTPDAMSSRARVASIQANKTAAVQATPAPSEPTVALDTPSPQDALPDAAKATSPPAAHAPAPQTSGTMADRPPAPPHTSAPADTAAAGGQPQAPQADSNPVQSPTRTNASAGDEPADDVPPATADSPAVRDAWLQRIRSLLGDGNIVDARLSLDAFIHRYPNYPLPEDLHALARSSISAP